MRIFIWIENTEGELFRQAGEKLARMYGGLELDAFTARSREDNCVADGKELRFVEMDAVKDEAFDTLLVVGRDLQKESILQECRDLGIDDAKVVFDFEACLPGFTLERSSHLHRCQTSVFSINSWGRKVSEKFQLPFCSPFVDSVMTTEDYLALLGAPQEYLGKELAFCETFGTADGREFPVFRLGEDGLKVYMLHETDAENAKSRWIKGIEAINWHDLLIMMYTDSKEVLDRFDCLPYGKKVCFTSFESRLDSAFYLPALTDEEGEERPLWTAVENLLESTKPYYDLWDLLLYGRRSVIHYA